MCFPMRESAQTAGGRHEYRACCIARVNPLVVARDVHHVNLRAVASYEMFRGRRWRSRHADSDALTVDMDGMYPLLIVGAMSEIQIALRLS